MVGTYIILSSIALSYMLHTNRLQTIIIIIVGTYLQQTINYNCNYFQCKTINITKGLIAVIILNVNPFKVLK